ncbi:hypothetical protein Bca101_010399 [Brassica carinata]
MRPGLRHHETEIPNRGFKKCVVPTTGVITGPTPALGCRELHRVSPAKSSPPVDNSIVERSCHASSPESRGQTRFSRPFTPLLQQSHRHEGR